MNKTLLYSVIIFIAGSSYGFLTPALKTAAANGIFPMSFLPLQYLVALVLCVLAMFFTREKWGSLRTSLPMALLGIFTGGCSLCYYTSVSLLPSAAALTLLFQYVWVATLLDCVIKRKLPSVSSVLAIVVVLVGTLFAAGVFDGTIKSLDPAGVAFGAASAIFYALFLYFSGVIGADQPVALRTTMLCLGGLVITSLVNPSAFAPSLFNAQTGMFAILFSFIGIIIPTALINFASPKLSSSMVSIMASSELPVGILAAWAIVGDVPSPLALLGAVLVLVGILIKQMPALLSKSR